MARSSRARGGGGGRSQGGAASRRSQGGRATSRKSTQASAPMAEVEVVEEKKGLGIDDGIPIMTTLVLLVAILMTDYILGSDYGAGLFFK